MAPINFTTQSQQGSITAGFTIELSGDYIALVGENNSGKSSILQCIFKKCSSGDPFNLENVSFLLPDRIYVDVKPR
jgi:ABC-type cobalamin/Fe3+-siderophores transport system ATPase subunit